MDPGDILIAAAVPGELEGMQSFLTGVSIRRAGQQEIISGRMGGQRTRLAVTGPGLANTVHGMTAAVTVQPPRLILQVGCGGGFSQAGLDIGDVVVATAEIDAHLGVETERPGGDVGKLPFPVIARADKTIFSCYPVDEAESGRACEKIKAALADTRVNVFTGPIITVATVTASKARAETLYRCHQALVENMEGAGTAHVAALYDIPFVEIRVVSNRVGDRDKSRWDLPLAFQRCSQAVRAYLLNP